MRIYLDGCFDLAHYGHFNAMRQAKALGSHLVVGVVADESVAFYKVTPVMTLEERCEMVRSMKWVDDVIPGVSHVLDWAFTAELRREHGIALVVHGDDESTMPDGSDPYDAPKKEGMFWVIPRTDGISTTDLVAALLAGTSLAPCPTPLRLPPWEPVTDAVYVDGAFDCLHPGHIAFLKEARKFGKHLVVGVHADDVVKDRRGVPTVLSVQDRARALSHCKYIDGVLPGSPPSVTMSFLKAIGACCVARGAVHETCVPDRERYKGVATRLVYVLSPSTMTLATLKKRIEDQRESYLQKVQ